MRKTAPTRKLVSYLLIFQHPKAIFKSLSGMTLFLVMGAGNELKSHGLILMTTSIACQCESMGQACVSHFLDWEPWFPHTLDRRLPLMCRNLSMQVSCQENGDNNSTNTTLKTSMKLL